MTSCVFNKCKNNGRNASKESGVTFHKFPMEPKDHEKWSQIVQIERNDYLWTAKKYSRVCSNHFTAECFYTTPKGYKKLKASVAPTFTLQCQIRQQDDSHGSPLRDVHVSVNKAIEDTITIIDLKQKLQQMTKKKLRYQSANKKLKRQNKELKKQNINLKNINTDLKNVVKTLKFPSYIGHPVSPL